MFVVKWFARIVVGLLALLLICVTVPVVTYFVWESHHLDALHAGSEVIQTARGAIEYAVAGEGTPRLTIHGTPGGYDQGLVPMRVRAESVAGQQLISVSRPGYLRTPLASGRTPAEQADLYAALLDELDVDRAVVWAGSGGAPSALQFALRYPERTIALILSVPLLTDLESPLDQSVPTWFDMKLQDISYWFVANFIPASVVSGLDPDDPIQTAAIKLVLETTIPESLRSQGHRNDAVEFRRLDFENWPLETLTVPTLIIHGTADRNAPYEASVRAAERLPNSELVTFENSDHLIVVTRAPEITAHVNRFLAQVQGAGG